MGAFGKNSSAKTLIILKIIFFIIILDKNKPILIIAHYFYKKGPNMVFGKIFSKNIPYNSNIWNYNPQFISWSFLSECLLYFLLFFLSRLVILLFIFLLINIYYKYN